MGSVAVMCVFNAAFSEDSRFSLASIGYAESL
jgi:hypothetical protein